MGELSRKRDVLSLTTLTIRTRHIIIPSFQMIEDHPLPHCRSVPAIPLPIVKDHPSCPTTRSRSSSSCHLLHECHHFFCSTLIRPSCHSSCQCGPETLLQAATSLWSHSQPHLTSVQKRLLVCSPDTFNLLLFSAFSHITLLF
jgi:hypothetical protein